MQVGEFAVTVAKISVDAPPGRMAGIIGVGYGEALRTEGAEGLSLRHYLFPQ